MLPKMQMQVAECEDYRGLRGLRTKPSRLSMSANDPKRTFRSDATGLAFPLC
jgi:hypothetical protein